MYEVKHSKVSYGEFPLFVQAVQRLWELRNEVHCHIERDGRPWSSYLDSLDAAREYGWVVNDEWTFD